MFTLDSGNVLLKPSHRKQVLSWLRRTLKLGQRVGRFVLTINMNRSGRFYEARASVHDAAGSLECRTRRHDWKDALRDLIRRLTSWLHEQHLRRSPA